MLENIKLISIDLDGTLFDSNGIVSASSMQVLKTISDRGILLVFNTARPFKMIPKWFYDEFKDCYWLLSNGTTCIQSSEVVFHETIEKNTTRYVLEKIRAWHPNLFFSVEAEGEIFTANQAKAGQYYSEYLAWGELIDLNINKIILIDEHAELDHATLGFNLPSGLKLLITEHGKYASIMDAKISKLNGVEKILKRHDLDILNVLAFGDDLNDLDILRYSAIGVATQNACTQVIEIADFTTRSNDEEGVRSFLEVHLDNLWADTKVSADIS